MTKTFEPRIYFKGERNYIHSPEVYDSILAGAQACGFGTVNGPTRITLRSLARHQLRYIFRETPDSPTKPPTAMLDFSLNIDGDTIDGWAEETDEEIEDRLPYDEGPIHSVAIVEGEMVSIREQTPYSAFEVMASISVLLHNTVAPSHKGMKWLASRYDLTRPLKPQDAMNMDVRLRHRLGDKMTKSEIVVSGESIGHTFFSMAPP